MNLARQKWLFAIALLLLCLQPSAGIEAPLRGETEGRRRLVFLIASDWGGAYAADERGYGGLAALHAYARNRRQLLSAERGGLILLHVGTLTNADKTSDVTRQLYPEGIDLLRYLELDGALVPRREWALIETALPKPAYAPFIDFRNMPPSADIHATLPVPYRIVRRAGLYTFVSGLNVPTEGGTAEALVMELARNKAADAQVILLTAEPQGSREAPAKSARTANKRSLAPRLSYFAALQTRAAATGTARPLLETLRQLDKITNPFDAFAPRAEGAPAIVALPSSAGTITLGTDGTVYCRIPRATVCELEFTYRRRTLVSFSGRMLAPNSAATPTPHVTPDPILTKAYPAPPAK